MEPDRGLSLRVGAFVLVALAALAVIVLSLSAEQGVFRARYPLVAYFGNIQGLVPGAAVRLAGTRVGQVKSVAIVIRQDGSPAVRVDLQVDDAVRQRLREDSIAEITQVGVMGDQIVQLSIGTSESPVLTDGAEVRTRDPFELSAMIAQGGRALDAIDSLARNLNDTLDDFQATGGTAGLVDTLDGLSSMVAAVRNGDGALHTLIYEPYQGSALSNLEATMGSLANIMLEVESGDGLLHSLIYDAPAEQDVLMQFLAAGARLNSILGKVDRGEGTLGLLLNDPTLYEEVKLLVGGANRSTVVRSLIQMVLPAED
ncbi:MAG: MCE family protein [Deltaproteobacteria bacterium]|nr:MCE family protein [Deltaproteobacteria bacterium]MBW2359916.1 MCE family protein [Deltaproteobacteria bacterium]